MKTGRWERSNSTFLRSQHWAAPRPNSEWEGPILLLARGRFLTQPRSMCLCLYWGCGGDWKWHFNVVTQSRSVGPTESRNRWSGPGQTDGAPDSRWRSSWSALQEGWVHWFYLQRHCLFVWLCCTRDRSKETCWHTASRLDHCKCSWLGCMGILYGAATNYNSSFSMSINVENLPELAME